MAGMSAGGSGRRRKRKVAVRRKRTLDPNIIIDYRNPDSLKRFITDRGKIIPRRISGATAAQQRQVTQAVKRARYLALIPFSVSHVPERGFAGEMAAANAAGYREGRGGFNRDRGDRDHRGDRDNRDRGDRGDSRHSEARSSDGDSRSNDSGSDE